MHLSISPQTGPMALHWGAPFPQGLLNNDAKLLGFCYLDEQAGHFGLLLSDFQAGKTFLDMSVYHFVLCFPIYVFSPLLHFFSVAWFFSY